MRRNIAVLIGTICVMLFLSACGSSSPIVGKWKDEASGRSTMEFLDDGTLKMYVKDQLKTTATYKLDGDSITLKVNGVEMAGTYKIEGNKLTLTQSIPRQTTVYVKQ